MNKGINFAVIGCGFWGRQLACAFHKAKANLVGVVDINPQLATELALSYPDCEVFSNSEDLCQQLKPDLVVIATPNYAHYIPALNALKVASHIFIDTPFTLNSKQAQHILAMAEKQQKKVFIGHLQRTLPGILKVKALLEENALGKISVVRATRQRWIENQVYKEWWKQDAHLTGGDLFHQIHELDLLCWFIGDIEYVYAQGGNQLHPEQPNSQDILQLLFCFKNGTLGSLEMGTAYRLHRWGISLHGEKGVIEINFFASSVTFTQSNGTKQHYHLYDEFEADLAMRENSKGVQQYNKLGAVAPFWLSRSAEIEASYVIENLLTDKPCPLMEKRLQAVKVAEAVKYSMIAEKQIYLTTGESND